MLIIAGTFKIDSEIRDNFLNDAEEMILLSRKEEGCLSYSFMKDLYQDSIIRVYELWESQENIKNHIASAHSLHWNQNVLTGYSCEIDIKKYNISKVGEIEDWE